MEPRRTAPDPSAFRWAAAELAATAALVLCLALSRPPVEAAGAAGARAAAPGAAAGTPPPRGAGGARANDARPSHGSRTDPRVGSNEDTAAIAAGFGPFDPRRDEPARAAAHAAPRAPADAAPEPGAAPQRHVVQLPEMRIGSEDGEQTAAPAPVPTPAAR